MQEYTFTGAIRALKVGESATRTHNISAKMTLGKLREEMNEMKKQVRNNGMTCVRSVMEGEPSRQFTAEVVETIRNGEVRLLLIVTRLA